MRTANRIALIGDEEYITAIHYRYLANQYSRMAEIMEQAAIVLWAEIEKDPPPCLSTDSSASPSA
jgi:hypothetical protein